MGYKLYREIRDRAPADWTPGERLVALMIADHADEETRLATRLRVTGYRRPRDGKWVDGLTDRTGLSAAGVSKALQRLAGRGLEFRVPISKGEDGRLVFAAKGHALDFIVPDLPQRPDDSPGYEQIAGAERADEGPGYDLQRADRGPQRPDRGPPPFPQPPSDKLFPQTGGAAPSPPGGGLRPPTPPGPESVRVGAACGDDAGGLGGTASPPGTVADGSAPQRPTPPHSLREHDGPGNDGPDVQHDSIEVHRRSQATDRYAREHPDAETQPAEDREGVAVA